MNIFELQLFDDNGSECTFYTVKWDDQIVSETNKFIEKYEILPKFESSLNELFSFIVNIIGNKKGAKEIYFRFENSAQALPPSGTYQIGEITIKFGNFPLRLYCLRISEKLVILFNGAEKTSQTAQDGNTSIAFREANIFAKKIVESLANGEIIITANGRNLQNYNNTIPILIY